MTEKLLDAYESLTNVNYDYLGEDVEGDTFDIFISFEGNLPAFDCEIVVESAVDSDPIILHGSGWELMVGRRGRDEIEGLWRPKSKEEALVSPYQPRSSTAGGDDEE